MRLGVCYYPEHWPESDWAGDATRMREAGISVVRIGEFAWSRLEPSSGQLEFEWLRRAIETLAGAGLEVVLGTPTATPPKWLIEKHPDILAKGPDGRVREFGSRRHYCFSSRTYREQCRRIVTLLGEHFGQLDAVIAWQTDNEYGCHDTTLSYSDAAEKGFRRWCSQRYHDIAELNRHWGNVFWSMEYNSFDQIALPTGTVTESNPAHRMAFWRYSSDQVSSFNKLQTDLLRRLSPGRDLIHNFMGNFTDFDHYAVAEDLDVASWDNYPLGFLDRDGTNQQEQLDYLRTGHPDSSAFHHDLYRGVGKGRCWLMEQQPGPVNWAPHNPAPLDGMVRLWGWEAYAHELEVVSWFRWRQAPFAQEQTHTGLCLPNGKLDTGGREVIQLAEELNRLSNQLASDEDTHQTPVALLFDYASDQLQRVLRFGGDAHDPLQQTLAVYTACRRCGLNIDIVPVTADLSGYQAILIPNYGFNSLQLIEKLASLATPVLLFPGSGARTEECAIPAELAPGRFKKLIDITIVRSESVPPFVKLVANTQLETYTARHWRERIESDIQPEGFFEDGWGFHYRSDNVHYLNAELTGDDLDRFIANWLNEQDIKLFPCEAGLRVRSKGKLTFAFNYGPSDVELAEDIEPLLGSRKLGVGHVAIWPSRNEQ